MRLFAIFGIDVHLHWLWFWFPLSLAYLRATVYSSIEWNFAETAAIFALVISHAVGFSLACRQAGGKVHRIVLLPIGSTTHADLPHRPAQALWPPIAGTLVNVAIFLSISILVWGDSDFQWLATSPDARLFLHYLRGVSFVFLILNLLPIYPLDGGQILRDLFWFRWSKARSLWLASIIGVIGAFVLLLAAISRQLWWIGVLAGCLFASTGRIFNQARAGLLREQTSQQPEFSCPSCHQAPSTGDFWRCKTCTTTFDTFATQGACPKCQAQYPETICFRCRQTHPITAWTVSSGPTAESA